MDVNIIDHDPETAKAVIEFSHNGVVYKDEFQLDMIIPGARQIFMQMDMPFDKVAQDKVIEKLTLQVERNIDDGIIKNPPPEAAAPERPDPIEPPVPPEPEPIVEVPGFPLPEPKPEEAPLPNEEPEA